GVSNVAAHWVINVFLLAQAALIAAAGRVAGEFGAGRLCYIGLTIYLAASILAGFSPDAEFLIAASFIQGVGAAMVYPCTMIIMTATFQPEGRGRANGYFATIASVMLALGPVVGGMVAELLSWRWVFWIGAPMAFICIVMLWMAKVSPDRTSDGEPVDGWGLLALIASIIPVTCALMQAQSWGWKSPYTLGLLGTGLVAGYLFVLREKTADDPLINLDIFRNGAASVAFVLVFLAQQRRIAVGVFGALFLRDVSGLSAFEAGLAMLPTVAILAFGSTLIGGWVDRYGSRPVILIGIGLVAITGLAVAFAMTFTGYLAAVLALVAFNACGGTMIIPPRKVMTNVLPEDMQGAAIGVGLTVQLLGATSIITFGSILLALTGSYAPVFALIAGLTLLQWPIARHCLPRKGAAGG
ncbi:MAG: MFS transporter, partial [Pseudomonadota bacterium]